MGRSPSVKMQGARAARMPCQAGTPQLLHAAAAPIRTHHSPSARGFALIQLGGWVDELHLGAASGGGGGDRRRDRRPALLVIGRSDALPTPLLRVQLRRGRDLHARHTNKK